MSAGDVAPAGNVGGNPADDVDSDGNGEDAVRNSWGGSTRVSSERNRPGVALPRASK